VDVVCTLINGKCSGLTAALADFGLTAEDVTGQMESVGLYTAVKQLPSGKIDERQVATEGIAKTIGVIRKLFKVMDRVVRTMEDKEWEFVEKYFNSREIYDL
jgi:hypothetical protein